MGEISPHSNSENTDTAGHAAVAQDKSEQPTPVAEPGVANARQVEAPPQPSKSNAFWLIVILLNIGLAVFLIPSDVLDDKQLSFVLKIGSVAVGVCAAGWVWIKNLMASIPQHVWFKVIQVAIFIVLVSIHVSKQPVVAMHPQVPVGADLAVDGQTCNYENGTIRMSIRNHRVKVSSGKEGSCAREYGVSYKDVFFAIFTQYAPHWTPLYQVTIDTNSPDVEVLIHKTDGDFSKDFREKPPPSELKLSFEPKSEANDTFVYRGANNSTGSTDHIELPFGEYELVARKAGCNDTDAKHLLLGKVQSYKVEFKPLCDSD